jgi:hypothetical protein
LDVVWVEVEAALVTMSAMANLLQS